MKTNKSKLIIAVAMLLSFGQRTFANESSEHQHRVVSILREFIDLSQNRSKKFQDYVNELDNALVNHPNRSQMAEPISILRALGKPGASPYLIAVKMKRFFDVLTESDRRVLTSLTRSKSENEMIAIFKQRLNA